MAQPRYITPAELWVLAWPPALKASDFEPGRIGAATKTGTGSGSILVTGFPRDALTVRFECVTGGEPGAATFRYWTDGANYGDTETWPAGKAQGLVNTIPQGTDTGDLLKDSVTGLEIAMVPGAPPSYVAGDRWVFTTRESAQVRAGILAGSARARRYLGARYQLGADPVQDASIKQDIAILCRGALLDVRGVNSGQDADIYLKAEARAKDALISIAKKLEHPSGLGEGPVYAPDLYEGADRGGIAAAHRRRGGARE